MLLFAQMLLVNPSYRVDNGGAPIHSSAHNTFESNLKINPFFTYTSFIPHFDSTMPFDSLAQFLQYLQTSHMLCPPA